MYMAESKAKEIDIWKDLDSDSEGKNENKKKQETTFNELLSKHDYKHNWGEAAYQFFNLEVYVYDLETKKLNKVIGIPKTLKIQKPLFLGPKGNSITFVGIEGEFPSGTVFCVNKDSGIYMLEQFKTKDVDSKKNEKKEKEENEENEKEEEVNDSIKISSDPTAFGLIVSPSGNLICYQFTSVYNESHFFNTGLKVYNRETKETRELISDTEEDGELSIYISPGNRYACYWDKNEKNVTFSNVEKARTVLNRVNIVTGERKKLPLKVNFETDSITVLEFCQKTGDALITLNNFYHCMSLGYIKGV